MKTTINQLQALKKYSERSFDATETMKWVNINPLWRMTWGATNFTKFEDKALFFTVNGMHHKGIVLITLAFDDTYKVTLLSSRWNVKKEIENVYCDELAEKIDIAIERISDYVM